MRAYGLLDLYFCTCSLESSLECFSSCLVNAFLYICGSSVNEILSFLQAKTARLLNSLNYLELSSTGALENNIERCLFLNSGFATCSGTSSNSNSCSSGLDSILFLEESLQFTNFLYCQIYQFFSNSFDICHFF